MSIATDLAAVLRTVCRPGDFFVSGTTELLAPLLEVHGVGPIALPLLPIQAEQLAAAAKRAPTVAVKRHWSTQRFAGPGKSPRIGYGFAESIGRGPWRPSWRGWPMGSGSANR